MSEQAQEELSEQAHEEKSGIRRFLDHPLVKSFIAFAIFRAFYGAGILVVTYFLATSESSPWWYSLLFLAFSMVFSRLLFRWIKRRRAAGNESDDSATLDTQSAALDS